MNTARIAELLNPFLEAPLGPLPLEQISIYIDLLLRWNQRMNLTAVRDPEEIVTRHFGESLFVARQLLPHGTLGQHPSPRLLDVGSGAGFPGLPVKIWSPPLPVTLLESKQKKVAFLREVIRALALTDIDVFGSRAELYPPASAGIVTLRAVERFDQVLPVAASRLAPGGTLALLIGQSQAERAQHSLPGTLWSSPLPIPHSSSRILLLGVINQYNNQ